MSYDRIIPSSKRVEALFRKGGYKGRGLHELACDAEGELPRNVIKATKMIATIRNKTIHEQNYLPTDDTLKKYDDAVRFIEDSLSRYVTSQHLESKHPERSSFDSSPIVIPKTETYAASTFDFTPIQSNSTVSRVPKGGLKHWWHSLSEGEAKTFLTIGALALRGLHHLWMIRRL